MNKSRLKIVIELLTVGILGAWFFFGGIYVIWATIVHRSGAWFLTIPIAIACITLGGFSLLCAYRIWARTEWKGADF